MNIDLKGSISTAQNKLLNEQLASGILINQSSYCKCTSRRGYVIAIECSPVHGKNLYFISEASGGATVVLTHSDKQRIEVPFCLSVSLC